GRAPLGHRGRARRAARTLAEEGRRRGARALPERPRARVVPGGAGEHGRLVLRAPPAAVHRLRRPRGRRESGDRRPAGAQVGAARARACGARGAGDRVVKAARRATPAWLRPFRLMWEIHKWLGIVLGALVLMVAATGIVLLLKKQS